MSIHLETLEHQEIALKAIMSVFENVDIDYTNPIYQNPLLNLQDSNIQKNINDIWTGLTNFEEIPTIPSEMRTRSKFSDTLNLDIKMETGTGKTYVYTRLMYEMNKLGFNKFVFLVPSVAVKEGTKNFMIADYAEKHFKDLYGNKELKLHVLEAERNQSKKKKKFPPSVADFARGTRLENNAIHALLTTSQMFISKATMEFSYDQTLLGQFTEPYETLKESRPIIIIDEPHRFKKENIAYQRILEKLQPQIIFRFGATFPEISVTGETDYDNLVYNLGAIDSFNNGLVKGVAAQTLENINKNEEKIKLMTWSGSGNNRTITFRNEETNNLYYLKLNQDLGEINPKLAGITIDSIGKTEDTKIKTGITLSNGMILTRSDIIYPSIFSQTYQDLMLKQAIKNHFLIEWSNFNRSERIKTLSLFFIDSIYSYRNEDGMPGHLRLKFEEYLLDEVQRWIVDFENKEYKSNREIQYLSFLKATKNDLSFTSGGYFSSDNSTKNEDVQKEVEEILRAKEKLLTFKNQDNQWNIRRFIFSKWTLKEGWDNPNVFQITKLRSSGSESSKLQEVGRGLRLPVDEFGNRINDEQFYLTYLVDYSELNFAKKLVGEINEDTFNFNNISDSLKDVAKKLNITENQLFADLLMKNYVDSNKNIIIENKEEFLQNYPEFHKGLKEGVIVDNKNENLQQNYVNINVDNYKKIQKLWEIINEKYYLKLESTSENKLIQVLTSILGDKTNPVFKKEYINVIEHKTNINDLDQISLTKQINSSYRIQNKLPYNVFLKKLNKETGVPVQIIHKSFIKHFKTNDFNSNFFNHSTLQEIILRFKKWYIDNYYTHYSYERLDIKRKETALTDVSGQIRKNLIQGNFGEYRDDTVQIPKNFLLDSVVYDSTKEKETIIQSGTDLLKDKIVVFGKIPRRSIQVPLYFGGTISPDFMYVIKQNNQTQKIGFIVETKGVDDSKELREVEKYKISTAKNFFETMKMDGISVEFKEQFKLDNIINMIEEILD